jgi:virulence factor Mce-like protein
MPYTGDISGRGPSTATLAGRGLIALAILVLVVVAMLLRYTGAFQSSFPATALVEDVGDGLRAGADVKLRGALVGRVDDVRLEASPEGAPVHQVVLRLRPEMAAGIPAGVTARVVPTNVFGAPSLELLDPTDGSTAMLARDGVIQGDRSAGTLQLQTVLNQLNRTVSAVRPAELNVALSNIAAALDGRGTKIGSIIGRADPYLTTLNGRTDDFNADLALLGRSVSTLADIAPELLDSVDNAVVTTRTVVEERAKLADTLTGGTLAANRLDDLLSDTDDKLVRLADDGRGILRVLAGQKAEIPRSLRNLSSGLAALGNGLDQGKGRLSLQFTLTPYTPYTAADCPRYGPLAGPNCPGGGHR